MTITFTNIRDTKIKKLQSNSKFKNGLILERIQTRKSLTIKSKPPFGMGNFKKGNILIVGEQSAKPPLHPDGQDPFCGMKGSSKWLNLWLTRYLIREEDLFWINALNLDGSKADILKITQKLKPSKIIALGNVASKLCEENNLQHVKVPHPAYWSRFHSKEIHNYPLIKELI